MVSKYNLLIHNISYKTYMNTSVTIIYYIVCDIVSQNYS